MMELYNIANHNKTELTLTNSSGITLTGASGLIEILITDAQTSAFNEKEYFYSLKI